MFDYLQLLLSFFVLATFFNSKLNLRFQAVIVFTLPTLMAMSMPFGQI